MTLESSRMAERNGSSRPAICGVEYSSQLFSAGQSGLAEDQYTSAMAEGVSLAAPMIATHTVCL